MRTNLTLVASTLTCLFLHAGCNNTPAEPEPPPKSSATAAPQIPDPPELVIEDTKPGTGDTNHGAWFCPARSGLGRFSMLFPGLAYCGPLARGSAAVQSAVQALSCGSLLQGIFTPRRFLSRSPCEVTGGAVELSFNKPECRRCSGCDGADYRISGELRILDLSGTAVGTPDG